MEVAPCDSKGREYTEKDDMFVDSPDELVGKEVNFSFKIINCRGLPNKYTVIHKCGNLFSIGSLILGVKGAISPFCIIL